jgi:hypothetical protein
MWLIGLLAGIGATGGGAPTYLTCILDQDKGPLPVELVLDEQNQRASVSLPTTGRAITRPAIFSAATVSFKDEPLTYTVDRVTLALRRYWPESPDRSAGETGRCKVSPVPAKRAF